ncbi:MAG: PAQR family membrane homeostasis protein TrhA, partial [bacterium]
MNSQPHPYSHLTLRQNSRQEIANAVTHGVGTLLSVAALVLLVIEAARMGSPLGVVCAAVFGSSMVLLYVFSTLMHSLPDGRARAVFERLDLSGIFLLIAGTYTPFTLLALRGPLGWSLFGAVWGLAGLGMTLACLRQAYFERVASYLYLALGWLIVVAIYPLARNLGFAGFCLLAGGGLSYSIGVLFFLWRGFLYHHAVWHGFVILGSVLHFLA